MNTMKSKKNTSNKKNVNIANTDGTDVNKNVNIANADGTDVNNNVNIANTDVSNEKKSVIITNTDPNSTNTYTVSDEFNQGLQANTANTGITHIEFREGLQDAISKPQSLSLRVWQNDFDFWTEFKTKYETASEAFSALVKLATKQPEKIEKPIEVIKEIPIKLSPAQVIVTFGKETADKIRLCRPFIAQGNVLTYEKGNDSSFISALVNLSVNKTLERNFPAIMRRMNLKANS